MRFIGRPGDARRNRQRLIDAALEAFSCGRDPVALEAIAKEAGVGIGTLYRHFPSREALIEAVYRSELARLCDSVDDLLAELPPDEALHTWMARRAGFVTTKRGMAEALRAVIASGAITFAQTRARLSAAIQTMLDAGVSTGSLRGDVRADDVVSSLAGILLVSGEPDQREQADRMLDLLMDGLRPRITGPGHEFQLQPTTTAPQPVPVLARCPGTASALSNAHSPVVLSRSVPAPQAHSLTPAGLPAIGRRRPTLSEHCRVVGESQQGSYNWARSYLRTAEPVAPRDSLRDDANRSTTGRVIR